MTSKELNKILNQTRRTLDISLTAEQVEELIKDLEVLEILKKYNSLSLDCYEAITYGLLGKGYSAFYKFCEKMLETDEDEIPSENEFNLIKNWLERKE